MKPISLITAILAAAIFTHVPAIAQTAAPPEAQVGPQATCPASLSGLAATPGIVIGCVCPGGPAPQGSVWGSGPYTSDSNVCRAARHAGAVTDAGGVVWAVTEPGRDAYEGTAANGITTTSYGSYGASIAIFAAVAADMPPAKACPDTMQGTETTISCVCTPDRIGSNSVWGTDIYTEDRHICRAAVHAGVLDPNTGGIVTVKPEPGQAS